MLHVHCQCGHVAQALFKRGSNGLLRLLGIGPTGLCSVMSLKLVGHFP